MYYGYVNGQNLLFAPKKIEKKNSINDKDESYKQILKITGEGSNAEEEIIGDNLEFFGITNYYNTHYCDEWISFRADNKQLIYYFDAKSLCEIPNNYITIDLWNYYSEGSDHCHPINEYRNSPYKYQK